MRLTTRALGAAVFAAAFVAAIFGSPAIPAQAQQAVPPPIVLGTPVACAIPEICWVQNYFDHDPGPGAEDHTCGRRAYDRHFGIDFRVANLVVMRQGIPVIAAADGIVGGVRDGMDDTGIVEADASSVRGRECGNGVVVRHPNGWTTQYCHLLKGSIEVAKGQEVKKGTPLGKIGLSGLTEFPHVHFEVRNGNTRVDPFVGFEATGKCGTAGKPLFEAALIDKAPYVETGLLNAGFTDRPPKGSEVLAGEHANTSLPVDAAALIYWVELFGTQPGDRAKFTILAPDGSVLVSQTRPAMESHSARNLSFTGRRIPPNGWPPGEYKGLFELLRDGAGETKVAFRVDRTVQVGDPQNGAIQSSAPPPATPAPQVAPPPSTTANQVAATSQTAEATPAAPAAETGTGTGTGTETGTATETARSAPAGPPPQAVPSAPVPRTVAERAEDLLPVPIPRVLQRPAGHKGPPPWLIAAGLLGVILGLAGVAYITRR